MRTLPCWLLVLGCMPQDPPAAREPANLRPAGTPDVVVLSFSGHDATPTAPFNAEYLVAQGALPVQVASMFETRGFTTQVFAYGDEFYDNGGPHRGFLSAFNDLGIIWTEWIADYDDPTRVIVIGHSHGGVWAHTLAGLVPAPIDVLVSLDAVSHGWESPSWATGFAGDNWQMVIDDYNAFHGYTYEDWGFDFAYLGGWILPDGTEHTIDDVVFPNVAVNLEYQSSSPIPTLSDWEANRRFPDGTTQDILTSATGELHGDSFGGGIAAPTSIATRHAVSTIEAIYFGQ